MGFVSERLTYLNGYLRYKSKARSKHSYGVGVLVREGLGFEPMQSILDPNEGTLSLCGSRVFSWKALSTWAFVL